MAGRGKYVRTPEIRARNRANARPGQPCKDDCACAKHYPHPGRGGRKCEPGCDCLRHYRTPEHNIRIGISVTMTRYSR